MPRNEFPIGFCQCGCGAQTEIAKQTRRKSGWVQGRPLRFVAGHSPLTRVHTNTKLVHGAACPACKHELYFFTDTIFGALFEQCTNTQCANAKPHRPRPDPDCGKPRQSELDRLEKRAQMATRRRQAQFRKTGAV